MLRVPRGKRLTLLIGATAALLTAAVVAPLAVATSSAQPKLESSLVFAAPGGTVQTGLQTCAIDGFEKKYGVQVSFQAAQPVQNLALVAAQQSHPTIDVMWTSEAEQYIGTHHGFFAPLSYADVPNSLNVPAATRTKLRYGFDKSGIPLASNIAGIEYNAKLFQSNGWAPPKTWSDLWDPKYKGHVAIYDLPIPFGQAFLDAMGKLNGGNEAHIDPAFARLTALKPSLGLIASAAAQIDQGFQNNSIWIAVNTGSRALALKQSGFPVTFVNPTQGVLRNELFLDVVKNAPHPNAAKAFINWMLSTPIQSCLAAQVGYAPFSTKASVPSDLGLYLGTKNTKAIPIAWASVEHNLSSWLSRWNKSVANK
jgi:putative spermidine/putrescine transport system substrate-binding protein